MKKLIETLRSLGIEVPENKESEVRKKLSENYKNIAEVEKTTNTLETDRNSWKERAEAAEETLKKFDGVDLDTIQGELADWKQKAADAEKNAQKQIYERDFADALKAELESVKFTSEAAKRDVTAQIKAAELKLKDGKILGLSDLIGQIKKADASAFVDEQQEQLEAGKAKPFTQPLNGKPLPTSKEKFANMSLDERMELKASDPAAYERMRKGE